MPRYFKESIDMGGRKFLISILILFTLLFVLSVGIIHSQIPVTRSTEKVVIRGRSYYIHKVEKGQTAFSIARAYFITVEMLHSENPDALYGLKEGQILKIPVVDVVAPPVREKDTDKYIYHIVEAGETVYSLSRRYDVDQAAILEANPGLDPTDMAIGSEIAIPRKEFRKEVVSIAPRQPEYFLYQVKSGETISSISRKFGVPARELRKLNGGTIFLRAGDAIRVPGRQPAVEDILPPVADSLVLAERADTLPAEIKAAGFTDISVLRGSIDIAVMLPLFLDRNAVRTEIDSTMAMGKRIRERPFQWIYPETVSFLEMYEGILIAADDLRDSGLDVKIHTFDTRADPDVVDQFIRSGRLRDADLIIGPIHSFNLLRVLDYADRYGIPVVSPVPLQDNSILKEHPSLYVVNTSATAVQETLARAVAQYYDNNLVLVYSDTSRVNNESEPFRNMLMRELSFMAPIERINFKQLLYKSRSGAPSDTLDRLSHALNPLTGNVVILGTENDAAIHETITDLHRLIKKYRLTVFGYPSVRNLEANIDLNYLFGLGIYIYSPFFVDFSSAKVQDFLAKYRSLFAMEPNENSFAWTGYDIVRYFSSGLAMHGRRFLSSPGIHNPELLNAKFDFRRESPGDGFENRGLYLLRYTDTMDMIIVSEPGIYNGNRY